MFAFDNNLKTSSSSSQPHHLPNPNPPFFSNFPSPFFDEHELPLQALLKPTSDPIEKPGKRKRTAGKKDRHSKICTAHGIRDRRMRLSLHVARKFFDIQDMLGYDKASATIEWLFSKSKQAIRELVEAKKTNKNDLLRFDFSGDSFSSECEAVSGVAHEATSSERNELGQVLAKKPRKNKNTRCRPKESVRELREKARARARWRTREKMMVKQHESETANSDQKLGFGQELSGSFQTPCLLLSQDHDTGTIEKLLGKSSLDNYGCCIDLMGDWEMLGGVTNQEGVVSSSILAAAGNYIDDI